MAATPMEVVDPTACPEWDDLIAAQPNATAFHTSAWARVIRDTYGYRPAYFRARDPERVTALIPFMEIHSWLTGKRGVSLPFTDECTPLLPDGLEFDAAAGQVMDFAASRGWQTVEFRGQGRGMGRFPAADEYLSHALDLTGTEAALFSRYSQNVQRNLRKAERNGIEVENGGTPSGVREFYRLNCLTRRDHGVPPQPFLFFENLRKHILEKDLGTLLLARHREKAVAGAVFLHFGRKGIYKYGASDRRHLDLRANHLVFQAGIRTLCKKGIETLSFGRTDPAQEGLRRFKLSWGARETRLQYFRFDVRSNSWLALRKARFSLWEGLMSKMPIPVLRLVGDIAYRHIG